MARSTSPSMQHKGDAGRFASGLHADVVDLALAGVLTGLEHAAAHHPDVTHVISLATDAPFLPHDLSVRLMAAVADRAEMAQACRRTGFAIWPVAMAAGLRAALVEDGLRRIDDFTARHDCAIVEFAAEGAGAPDPFTNLNTPEDLEAAQTLVGDWRAMGARRWRGRDGTNSRDHDSNRKSPQDSTGDAAIGAARGLFAAYGSAITRLDANLGLPFAAAVELVMKAGGHVVVCGMGKSGLIGRKIAATLASTGTPSLFLHPAEAIHGDLGMVRRGDVVIVISNSGETEEIVRILPAFQRLDARIIAMTASAGSSLSKAAEITLDISVDREAVR